ncbi:MAG: prepilin peptidase, partial [Erysipelotrichaceae bacterium]|nr:prepilin peptidase [Erysipelotrichaceae bacterium]
MYWYLLIIYALFGLVIGSFLNVCIWRIPKGLSVAAGRSFCPNCNHELAAKDLIPILSWILLGGKCRYCKAPVS